MAPKHFLDLSAPDNLRGSNTFNDRSSDHRLIEVSAAHVPLRQQKIHRSVLNARYRPSSMLLLYLRVNYELNCPQNILFPRELGF